MNILQGKTALELLDWLKTEGLVLAKEERDVRLTTHSGMLHTGSVFSVSLVLGKLTMCTYGSVEAHVVVRVEDIASVEILNSHRLRVDEAYQQMNQMMAIVSPDKP